VPIPLTNPKFPRGWLCMAIAVRGGSVAGVLFHTDQGGEYTGELFTTACRSAGATQSMGCSGSALDNAAAESFQLNHGMGVIAQQPLPHP